MNSSTIGSTVLGEYLTCNLSTTPRERAKAIDNTKKRKSDAPFGLCDDDDDDNRDLTEFNDGDSHIKRDDNFIWPSNFIQLLQDIMALPCPNPSKPQFEFDLSVKAAEKNYILLMQKFEGDLHCALHTQKNLPLSYGSEFKLVLALEPIFSQHPNWPRMTEDHPFGGLNLAPIAFGRI